MTRTENCIRNVKYAIVGQAAGIAISFFSRMVFVHILGREYLGLDGLFSNIISVLSIVELGVGTAIVFSMYKPLADGDEYRLKALMDVYKKAYISIGITVAAVGSALTPFLRHLIRDMPDIPYISLLYLLFVANSALSYFFSYKRSLIIADQRRYIITAYRYGFYFFVSLAQILILIVTKAYIIYILLQIAGTLAENMLISRKADKLYPFLLKKESFRLDKEDRNRITKNIKAMIFHKLGDKVVTGTDNILISRFVGIAEVGLYSNYLLITNALNMVYGLIFQSLIASIGNLGAEEDARKNRFIFDCINFICFWIHGFSSICLVVLLNPFIKLWLSKEYVFSHGIVLVIVFNFYINGMRKSAQAFKEAYGLFWYDRYKPLAEALINLAASVVLAIKLGIAGILLGTAVSTVTTCFWIEPYVLYKYGLKAPVSSYYKRYALNTLAMAVIGTVVMLICGVIKGETFAVFFAKAVICAVLPNVFFVLIYCRTEEFRYILNIFKEAAIDRKMIMRGRL